ncbi:MAG: substrate-binding domain-containing protein [Burkholderiales bacterium]
MAVRAMLAELAHLYEARTAVPVRVESVGGVDAERRVRDGEALDFVVLARDAIDRLASAGRVDPDSRVDLALSRMAVAIRDGIPRPAIDSEEGVRDAILAARTIGYSTGPSGRHLMDLLARWGIDGAVASRLVQAPPGIGVGALLARGDADIGFQQASEFLGVQGIEVLGPLPDAIQSVTVFAGAVGTNAASPGAARDFLAWLASDAAAGAKQRNAMA